MEALMWRDPDTGKLCTIIPTDEFRNELVTDELE
jgi:hypothetical protein